MTISNYWYFAYGSNLDIERMATRSVEVYESVRCRLPGYRLVFNKKSSIVPGRTFANVIPDRNHEVWGVAYRCSAAAIESLDRFEGVSEGHYQRIPIDVLIEDGTSLNTQIYIACADFIADYGIPTDDYINLIIAGAIYHRLPEEYIHKIKEQITTLKMAGSK